MSQSEALAQLEHLMLGNIPLAAATEARFINYAGECLEVTAPLAPNSNHHGTAFGGSLYVVALAAGWGLTHLLVTAADIDAAIYVQQAQADYSRPVTRDLHARATLAEHDGLQRFLAELRRAHKARLATSITIGDPEAPAFTLHARFAAKLRVDA